MGIPGKFCGMPASSSSHARPMREGALFIGSSGVSSSGPAAALAVPVEAVPAPAFAEMLCCTGGAFGGFLAEACLILIFCAASVAASMTFSFSKKPQKPNRQECHTMSLRLVVRSGRSRINLMHTTTTATHANISNDNDASMKQPMTCSYIEIQIKKKIPPTKVNQVLRCGLSCINLMNHATSPTHAHTSNDAIMKSKEETASHTCQIPTTEVPAQTTTSRSLGIQTDVCVAIQIDVTPQHKQHPNDPKKARKFSPMLPSLRSTFLIEDFRAICCSAGRHSAALSPAAARPSHAACLTSMGKALSFSGSFLAICINFQRCSLAISLRRPKFMRAEALRR
mmetsp:Transcript_172368/g.552507  ORF Transcript_172368/g.552507 Transcript_172368/m.552507 type:complete len:339 (+) Transcript_172368:243-1259(+)